MNRDWIETELMSRGVLDHMFVSVQPVVEIATGRLVGAEAFIRWHDPANGPVAPMDWIPVAQRVNALPSITAAFLPDIAEAAPDGLRISINVFGTDLQDDEFLDAVQHHATTSRGPLALELHAYEFERGRADEHLSQFVWPEVPDRDRRLAEIRSWGVEVWLDDMTSASPVLMNMTGTIDRIKLDRSVIKSAPALRDVTTSLHDRVDDMIAEGVETDEDVDRLIELGVRYGQGYRLGAPVTLPELRSPRYQVGPTSTDTGGVP